MDEYLPKVLCNIVDEYCNAPYPIHPCAQQYSDIKYNIHRHRDINWREPYMHVLRYANMMTQLFSVVKWRDDGSGHITNTRYFPGWKMGQITHVIRGNII